MSSERTVHVELSGESNWSTHATAGPHTVINDVPDSLGGKDLAQTPEEMLMSAYGSCTAMTVAMYARRKEWPLEQVAVDIEQERKPGKPARLTRTIRLTGALDAEQEARLLQIAEKCPVHRILANNELHSELSEIEES